MVDFSWNEWLRSASSSKKRKPRVVRTSEIEGLENRTLLTAPVAVDDSGYVVNEDQTLNSENSVLDNDTDVEEDIASADLDIGPMHASSFTLNPNGTFTYTPAANFVGTDSFTYHAVDGTPEDSNIVTVSITVNPVADLTAADDTFVIPSNAQLVNTVANNDSTTSGGVLSFALTTDGAHGTAAVDSDGAFTYTPDTDYNGLDSFTYTVTDAAANETSTRTVTIKVGNNIPVANSGTDSVDKDSILNGTLTGTDSDLDPLTFSAGTVIPAHGQVVIGVNGSYTYTPTAGYVGQDTFSFIVNDGTANSTEATITIDVINHVPTANPATPTTNEDTPLVGQLTGADLDDDPLTFAAGLTTPAHGTVTVNADGSYLYTPTADYSGPDSFSFTVSDGTDTSVEATVTITVTAVNDIPLANTGTGSTSKNVALNGTLTASDVDDVDLTFSAGTVAPAHGTLTINADGTYLYTPAADFDGQDTFSFKVNDGAVDSTEALVTITVLNNAPTVTAGTGTTAEDTPFPGSVSTLGTDLDGDPLTYTVIVQPTHGTLAFNPDGTFTYTPDADYNGPDSFTFQANDGALDSNVGTFDLTVTSVEDVLTLDLAGTPVNVAKDKVAVILDSTATVNDSDTTVDYAGARIVASISAGGHKLDALQVNGGPLTVKGKRIFADSILIAKTSGGKKGKALSIEFTATATQEAVNAVLQQLSIKTGKKAASGARTVNIEVTAGGATASGAVTANVA